MLTQLHWVCGFSGSLGHSVHCCSLLVPYTAHLKSLISLESSLGVPVQWSIPSPSYRGLAGTCQSDAVFWELWAGPMSRVAEARVSFLYPEVSQSLGVVWGVHRDSVWDRSHVSNIWEQGRVWAKPVCTQSLAQRESWLPTDSVCSQDDQYYHFLAVTPLIYTVNKLHWLIFTLYRKQTCLKEVWTIPSRLCGLLAFCQLFHYSFPSSLVLEWSLQKTH